MDNFECLPTCEELVALKPKKLSMYDGLGQMLRQRAKEGYNHLILYEDWIPFIEKIEDELESNLNLRVEIEHEACLSFGYEGIETEPHVRISF